MSADTTHRSDPSTAARRLQERLALPPSDASVLIWHEDDADVFLKVWVSNETVLKRVKVPQEFWGYPVVVDVRPRFVGLL